MRTEFDVTLSVDLIDDFDFKLTFYDRYGNQPSLGNEKNDYGLTLGLSWSN